MESIEKRKIFELLDGAYLKARGNDGIFGCISIDSVEDSFVAFFICTKDPVVGYSTGIRRLGFNHAVSSMLYNKDVYALCRGESMLFLPSVGSIKVIPQKEATLFDIIN